MPTLVHALPLIAFSAFVIAAAIKDLTSYVIPNRLCAGLALAFAPAAAMAALPPATFGLCLAVGAVAFVVGIGVFALGVLGGGDAKLMAACLLWLGPPAIAPFLIWTAVAGGGLAVTLLFARRLPSPVGAAGPAWFGRLMQPGADVPYGVAIALGALAAFPTSAIATAAHIL